MGEIKTTHIRMICIYPDLILAATRQSKDGGFKRNNLLHLSNNFHAERRAGEDLHSLILHRMTLFGNVPIGVGSFLSTSHQTETLFEERPCYGSIESMEAFVQYEHKLCPSLLVNCCLVLNVVFRRIQVHICKNKPGNPATHRRSSILLTLRS
jgi:hypothetical protein